MKYFIYTYLWSLLWTNKFLFDFLEFYFFVEEEKFKFAESGR